MSWQTVQLVEVADIERKGIDPSDIHPDTNYLGLEHIESGGQIIGSQRVQNGDLASTKFQFGPDHLLYGKLRPYLAKIALPDFEGICSTDILPVRPGPKLDRSFLAHYLRQQRLVDFASSRSTGANLPRLSPKALGAFEIPLPPLDEQKRIAAILDKADALRRLRTQALDKLNTLGQTIFHEMFGDPSTNPKGWPLGVIGDLLSEAKYGSSGKANSEGQGLPMLRMGNITYDGKIDLADLKHIELSDKEFDKYTTRRGDLLFNRTNSKDLVGKTAVVTQAEPMAIAGYLVRARANDRGDTNYISGYLNSPHGKAVLRNMCKNIVGMANINAKEFQSIRIALPPVDLQREYGEKLKLIEGEASKFEASREVTNSLFTSLQHRAFRGGL